ncbi:MAG: hypothetical protein K2X82_02140 [Gemmataceae bacterium]|nr:hypothetical protein [Gemmataceae bacterium]
MTDPDPTIVVDVDPSNPGQFFACCGLLELADRLWPDAGAEGWFEGGQFRIACGGDLPTLLAVLVMDPPEAVLQLDNGLPVKALIAPLRFTFDGGSTTAMTLDAWMTVRPDKGVVQATANPPWNFWSGQQTSKRIWTALREALAGQLRTLDPSALPYLFTQRLMLTGRFGFDPGPAWNPLDVGFSPNEQGIPVESSAAVELLAAVGLQRFRPRLAADRQSFFYATWGRPLGPAAGAAAAAGGVEALPGSRYRGRVVNRGQYAALGHSTPLRGAEDE